MRIDASNGKIIDSKEVYIHDDILNELCFYRQEKRLKLIIRKFEDQNDIFTIEFINVIGFEMTSCDFWGSSHHILDFEYVEKNDNTIIPKLFEIKDNNDYSSCTLSDQEKYIESVITFISGDQLRIACEEIVIEDK